MHFGWTQLALAAGLALSAGVHGKSSRKTCVVPASGSNATDDAPAIRNAFKACGHHGKIVFQPTTYYVNTVMNLTGLQDVEIDWRGTLLVITS